MKYTLYAFIVLGLMGIFSAHAQSDELTLNKDVQTEHVQPENSISIGQLIEDGTFHATELVSGSYLLYMSLRSVYGLLRQKKVVDIFVHDDLKGLIGCGLCVSLLGGSHLLTKGIRGFEKYVRNIIAAYKNKKPKISNTTSE